MNNDIKTFSKEFENLLDYVFVGLQNVRRIDGQFPMKGKTFSYSAYKIEPASGDPIIRIDIKRKT
jgi:hypothetical protein